MSDGTMTDTASGERAIGDQGPSPAAHTPGPWVVFVDRRHAVDIFDILPACRDGEVASGIRSSADASLIAAATDLLEAALALEAAEDRYHNDCEECGGEGVPEECPECFPLFDDARVMRRLAIAKALGQELPDRSEVRQSESSP